MSGDPVCWLHRLCPECSAVPSGDEETCWRCGAPVPDADPDATGRRLGARTSRPGGRDGAPLSGEVPAEESPDSAGQGGSL